MWTLIKCPWKLSRSNYQEIWAKTFCHRENSYFLFFEMFVSIDPLGPKKRSHQLHKAGHEALFVPIGCFLSFVMLNTTSKNRPMFFFTGDIASFQKIVFSTNSWVLKKCSYKFHSICQNFFWNLKNCPGRFVTLDNTKKIGQNVFSPGR